MKTVSSALERMAFLIVEQSDASPGEVLAQAFGHAVIDISGPGGPIALNLSATSGLIREIAAGMMGLEAAEIDVDEHGPATLMELANILGGELVMQLGGDVIAMQLGLPRQASDEAVGRHQDRIGAGHGWYCVVQSETGKMLVAVT